MPRVVNAFVTIALIVSSLSALAESKWYEGGTLHKSDVATWKKGSQRNKIATAADWTLVSPAVKATVQQSGNIDTNKTFAQELVTCIDTATEGVDVGGSSTDIALTCMVLMGWLK